jgi:hypothetical protein
MYSFHYQCLILRAYTNKIFSFIFENNVCLSISSHLSLITSRYLTYIIRLLILTNIYINPILILPLSLSFSNYWNFKLFCVIHQISVLLDPEFPCIKAVTNILLAGTTSRPSDCLFPTSTVPRYLLQIWTFFRNQWLYFLSYSRLHVTLSIRNVNGRSIKEK